LIAQRRDEADKMLWVHMGKAHAEAFRQSCDVEPLQTFSLKEYLDIEKPEVM